MRLKYLLSCLLLCLLAFLGSCAFAPVNRPPVNKYNVPNQKYYELPQKALLDMSQKALNAMGYQTSLVTENGPVMTATRPVLTQHNCDCGTWNNSPCPRKCGFQYYGKSSPPERWQKYGIFRLQFYCLVHRQKYLWNDHTPGELPLRQLGCCGKPFLVSNG